MADHPRPSRRLLLAGLLAATHHHAQAQALQGTEPRRGPLPLPSLMSRRGQAALRAGIDLDGTATAFRDGAGLLDGMAVRVGELLADGLDVELMLLRTDALRGVDELREGRFDILLNAPPLMIEVAREVLYADAYAHLDLTVVAPLALPIYASDALAKKRLGVPAGRTGQLVPPRLPVADFTLISLAGLDAMDTAVSLGLVDALAVPSPFARQLLARHATLEVKFSLGEIWLAPACRFGDHDLLRTVNTILHLCRLEGWLQALHQSHYERPLPRPPFF